MWRKNGSYLGKAEGRRGSKGGIKLTGSTALSHLFRGPRIMRFPRPSLMLCRGCNQPTNQPPTPGGKTAMNWPCPLFSARSFQLYPNKRARREQTLILVPAAPILLLLLLLLLLSFYLASPFLKSLAPSSYESFTVWFLSGKSHRRSLASFVARIQVDAQGKKLRKECPSLVKSSQIIFAMK